MSLLEGDQHAGTHHPEEPRGSSAWMVDNGPFEAVRHQASLRVEACRTSVPGHPSAATDSAADLAPRTYNVSGGPRTLATARRNRG